MFEFSTQQDVLQVVKLSGEHKHVLVIVKRFSFTHIQYFVSNRGWKQQNTKARQADLYPSSQPLEISDLLVPHTMINNLM